MTVSTRNQVNGMMASNGHRILQDAASTMQTAVSQVAQFYAGKSILITGATGFLGKVLLEKLMRSCPDVERIYVILRDKRGKTANTRLRELLNSQPFTFHEETQKRKHKVVGIRGDVTEPDMDLNKLDRQEIIDKVSVVFHVAASVKFDSPLKESMKQNVYGTHNVLQLCAEMRQLQCYIHVSTAYSNCHQMHIKEEFGPLQANPLKIMHCVMNMNQEEEQALTKSLIEGRPNSYCYTKAVAEHLVREYEHRFPAAIMRPSIVVQSVDEPAPGWVDSVNGPAGISTLAALGILRGINWNYWAKPDVIPVDIVTNAMLVAAVRTAQKAENQVKIYNLTGSYLKGVYTTWGAHFEVARSVAIKHPSKYMIRLPMYPPKHVRANPLKLWWNQMIGQLLFAHILDFIIRLAGHKPVIVRIVQRLLKACEVLIPFLQNTWSFDYDNFKSLADSMDPQDRERFQMYFHKDVDEDEYRVLLWMGLRRYILKEPDDTLPAARIKVKFLYVLEAVWFVLFWSFVGYLALKFAQIIHIM